MATAWFVAGCCAHPGSATCAVGFAPAADLAHSRMSITEMLRRPQAQPCGQLPSLLELARATDGGDGSIGRDRADRGQLLDPTPHRPA